MTPDKLEAGGWPIVPGLKAVCALGGQIQLPVDAVLEFCLDIVDGGEQDLEPLVRRWVAGFETEAGIDSGVVVYSSAPADVGSPAGR